MRAWVAQGPNILSVRHPGPDRPAAGAAVARGTPAPGAGTARRL